MHRRVSLVCEPTPLHPLKRLSEKLGIDLWIKRDDLSGFGGGGNKGRKLEYLIFDALEQGAEAIVTRGAWQSNFVRQCAAACTVFGLECHAAAMKWPYSEATGPTRPDGWPETGRATGNEALDRWLGANVRLYPDGTFNELAERAGELAKELRGKGKRVYEIPSGGSNGVGALGFVRAVEELREQETDFDQIVFASGSGATHAGLAYGMIRAGAKTRVVGISTDGDPKLFDSFVRIASDLDDLLLTKLRLAKSDFDLRLEFGGGGYQVPSAEAHEAIRLMARAEGIFLDPVYTAKAFAGLMESAKRGELTGRTLFWHTGGFPALFAEGREPQ